VRATIATALFLALAGACLPGLPVRADDESDESTPLLLAPDGAELVGVIPEDDVPFPEAAADPPATERLPAPSVAESLTIDAAADATPRVLTPVADGTRMLIDDFAVDEMPFEASSGRWFWSGGWYVGGESLWMDRSRNNRVDVAVESLNTNISYTTTAQPFNVAPGARATIGRSLGRDYLDRDRFFEFVYYGGMSYDDSDGWNGLGPTSLFTPLDFNAPGFNAAGQYTTSLKSDFNSWEWNYKLRRRLGRDQLVMSPNGNWTRHAERGWLPALIVGTRLANVGENFSLVSSRPGTPSADFSGDYRIATDNWLLGLNIGGELISQNEFYYWGLRGRAAPALTFASTNQTAYGVNTTGFPEPFPPGNTSVVFEKQATRTSAGFVGDLTLLAGWQVTPNFSLQAGYDFLWVAGMATATRQFDLDQRDTRPINTGGQTFYNGFSFGFNGAW